MNGTPTPVGGCRFKLNAGDRAAFTRTSFRSVRRSVRRPGAAGRATGRRRRRAARAGQRRTRGMPRPIQEMISRWISLLPPPKVKITALR